MRSTRLSLLLVMALLGWAASTQHRVWRLEAELLGIPSRLARADASGRATSACIERRLDELGASAALARAALAREIARTNERLDASDEDRLASAVRAAARIDDARAELAKLRSRIAPDPDTAQERMLAPTVQLNGDTTVGTGTLVCSRPNARTGRSETYVLTAYHVVRGILESTADAKEHGILHTIYTPTEKVDVRGDVVAFAERIDVALVKLRSTRTFAHVARVLGKHEACRVRVTDPVYAAGCPLGNDPILTRGEISALTNEVTGGNYWMLTAPTYFGNSGGGIYLADTLQLAGVFSKIYSRGRGNEAVVTHMGLCTPIASVHDWLEALGLAFVLEEAPAPPARDAGPVERATASAAEPCDGSMLSKR